jgi:hypothetical protein
MAIRRVSAIQVATPDVRYPTIPVIQIAANRAPQTITPNSSSLTGQTTTSSCELLTGSKKLLIGT